MGKVKFSTMQSPEKEALRNKLELNKLGAGFPAQWVQQQGHAVGSPVITKAMDTDDLAILASYVPAPILLSNGDIWVYVKTENPYRIKGYKSVDGGLTFTYQGTAISPGTAGAWDDNVVSEPVAVYDAATDTIHLWYKGGKTGEVSSVGYATASGTNPLVFTKYVSNPILTPAAVETSLGLTAGTIAYDMAISDVIKIDETVYFYGYYAESSTSYKMFYGTGANFYTCTAQANIMTPSAGYQLVFSPSVFYHKSLSLYSMIFTEGIEIGALSIYHLMTAYSKDGITWIRTNDVFRNANGRHTGTADEEGRVYAASMLKSNVSPYSEPEFVNERLLFYFSYSNSVVGDSVGLMYLYPQAGRAAFHSLLNNRAKLKAQSAQTIGNVTWTKINWTHQEFAIPDDMDALNRPDATTTAIVCRYAGEYEINAVMHFASNAVGLRMARILVDSSGTPDMFSAPAVDGDATSLKLTARIIVDAGSVIEIQVYQNSGGNLNTYVGYRPYFQVVRVGGDAF